MAYKITTLPNKQIQLVSFNCAFKTYQDFLNKEALHVKSSFTLPGFQKGKVPIEIVLKEKKQELEQAALNKLIDKEISAYVKEHKVEFFYHSVKLLSFNDEQIVFNVLIYLHTSKFNFNQKLSIPRFTITDNDLDHFSANLLVSELPQQAGNISLDPISEHDSVILTVISGGSNDDQGRYVVGSYVKSWDRNLIGLNVGYHDIKGVKFYIHEVRKISELKKMLNTLVQSDQSRQFLEHVKQYVDQRVLTSQYRNCILQLRQRNLGMEIPEALIKKTIPENVFIDDVNDPIYASVDNLYQIQYLIHNKIKVPTDLNAVQQYQFILDTLSERSQAEYQDFPSFVSWLANSN